MIKAEWTNKDSLDLQQTCNKLATTEGDLISRADAIEAVRMSEHRITIADEQGGVGTVKWDMWGVYTAEAVEAIKALPSAELVLQTPQTYGKSINPSNAEVVADYISRADAIKTVHKYFVEGLNNEPHEIDEDGDDVFTDMKSVNALLRHNKMASKALKALPSAEAVQGWIPCSERLPEDIKPVIVTWVNHNPPVYYQHIKDVPKANTAVYYRGAWYWGEATVIDLLGEYGGAYIHGIEPIDKDIVEVTAWMPLPEPYKGGEDE